MKKIVVAFAAVALVASCGQEVDSDSRSGPSPSPTPSASIDVPEGAVKWSIPAGADGWEMTIFDQDGVNQLAHTETGCLVTLSQNMGAATNAGPGDGPEQGIQNLLDAFERQFDNVQPYDVEGHEFGYFPGGINPVAFHTAGVQYLGHDGEQYVDSFAVQWFGDIELISWGSCTHDVWVSGGQELVYDVLGQTSMMLDPF